MVVQAELMFIKFELAFIFPFLTFHLNFKFKLGVALLSVEVKLVFLFTGIEVKLGLTLPIPKIIVITLTANLEVCIQFYFLHLQLVDGFLLFQHIAFPVECSLHLGLFHIKARTLLQSVKVCLLLLHVNLSLLCIKTCLGTHFLDRCSGQGSALQDIAHLPTLKTFVADTFLYGSQFILAHQFLCLHVIQDSLYVLHPCLFIGIL